MHIRPATTADAAALLAIYAPYVTKTAITFEYEVPSLDEFRNRITHTLQHYPYLVAIAEPDEGLKLGDDVGTGSADGASSPSLDGLELCGAKPTHGIEGQQSPCAKSEHEVILGYAYASPFKERAAYDWAVETSIYVAPGARHRGVGGKLHAALKNALVEKGIQNMCACITVLPEGCTSDPYVSNNSMEFHTHLGYSLVGRFHQVGYKFNRWYDMVWMELMIGDHCVPAPRIS